MSSALDVKTFEKLYRQKNKKAPILKANFDYIDSREYAEKTKLSLGTVQRLLLSGGVEGAFKIGREWRIPVEKE